MRVGSYRLEEILGEGGIAKVWRAWDEEQDRSVAIKRLQADNAVDPDFRSRFRREARAAGAIDHPAVVHLIEVIGDGEGDWIVMELVEGRSLDRVLAEEGPLPVVQALGLGRQIAEGLQAAHEEGVIHRDLKPENVMVTPDGRAKILDFGMSKRVYADESNSSRDSFATTANVLVGTARSMSPEQIVGDGVAPRSDVFSLGTLLYEMLTGTSPFHSDTMVGTLKAVLFTSPKPLHKVRPDVPEALSRLVGRMLEKAIALRPASALAVAVELEKIARKLEPTR